MQRETKLALEKIADLADAMAGMSKLKLNHAPAGATLHDTAMGEIAACETISKAIRSTLDD